MANIVIKCPYHATITLWLITLAADDHISLSWTLYLELIGKRAQLVLESSELWVW